MFEKIIYYLWGKGVWGFPGGHLEFGEEIEECAKREVEEETSLKIKNIHFVAITNDIFKKEKRHYITLFIACDYKSGKVINSEPAKIEKWEWFSWNALPNPLFLPIINLKKRKFDPFKSIEQLF